MLDNISITIKNYTMSLNKQINKIILNYIKNNKLTKQQINTLINNQIDSLINLNNDLHS